MMSIPIHNYTLALGLEDLLPVIGSAIGLVLLARLVARLDRSLGTLALSGAVLVTLGGAAKAAWKLIVAVRHVEGAAFLERSLFGLMAPGFAFIAIALLAATGARFARRSAGRLRAGAAAPVIVAITFAAAQTGSRAVELTLLMVTVLASSALLVRAISISLAQGNTLGAGMFSFSLFAAFALGFIGSREQTIGLQWAEQLTNTASQAAFAFAAFLLARGGVREEVPT